MMTLEALKKKWNEVPLEERIAITEEVNERRREGFAKRTKTRGRKKSGSHKKRKSKEEKLIDLMGKMSEAEKAQFLMMAQEKENQDND